MGLVVNKVTIHYTLELHDIDLVLFLKICDFDHILTSDSGILSMRFSDFLIFICGLFGLKAKKKEVALPLKKPCSI